MIDEEKISDVMKEKRREEGRGREGGRKREEEGGRGKEGGRKREGGRGGRKEGKITKTKKVCFLTNLYTLPDLKSTKY